MPVWQSGDRAGDLQFVWPNGIGCSSHPTGDGVSLPPRPSGAAEVTDMTYPTRDEISTRLRAALTGATTMTEFHRWLVPATWGIRVEDHPDAARLTFEITHLYHRRSAGEVTPNHFRYALAALVS